MKTAYTNQMMAGACAALALSLAAAPVRAQAPAAESDGWRVNATAYVWLQGVHGDGAALGQQISMDASASQLMSDADFDLQVLVNARYRRFVAIGDVSWTPFTFW